MATPRKKPGAKPGDPKPLKRTLDAEFPERLRTAMREAQPHPFTVPTLAPLVGCSRATLLNYLDGGQKVADPILLMLIAETLRVRPQWLVLGKGEMRDPPPAEPAPQYSKSAREAAAFVDSAPEARRPRLVSTLKTVATVVELEDQQKVVSDTTIEDEHPQFINPDTTSARLRAKRDALIKPVKEPSARDLFGDKTEGK